MSAFRLALLPVKRLKGHERVDPERVWAMVEALQRRPILRHPILVDAATHTILDGHHRHAALKALGLKKVPCLLVDYFSDEVQLEPRRAGLPVSKAEVVRRASRGEPFPPKTTKHTVPTAWLNAECGLPLPLGGRLCVIPA